MSNGASARDQHGEYAYVEERELRLLLGLPFIMLVIAAGLSAAVDHGSSRKVLEDVGLAAASGAWMLVLFAQRFRWRERRRLLGIELAVLVGLMAALVLRNPLFGFFTWTGYIWGSLALPLRWRALAYAPVAVITATSQHGGLPAATISSWASWVVFIAINLLAAGAVSAFARSREEEHVSRKRSIDELTEANAKLAASLRENAGLHAQLLAQAREAGILDERQRMAGEIHDTLAQGLVGIITQLEAAEQDLRSDSEARRRVEVAGELARESLAEARRSVRALAPAPLEAQRLPDALRTVAGKWAERAHVATTVTLTGEPRPVRHEIELALLRTAQEALANVEKHASAGQVVLTLSYMEEQVALDVRDDGQGFASGIGDIRPGAFGLTAMRQRVEGLAGRLEVESEPGAGTTIAASIPLIPWGAPEPVPGRA